MATAWRDIKSYDRVRDGLVWIGDTATGNMVIAAQSRHSGLWYYEYSDKLVPWLPDVWHPIPLSPRLTP